MRNTMESGILKTILIDDEPSANETLELSLSKHPVIKVIDKITSPETALVRILQHRPDMVFLDVQMPGMNGFELMELLAKTEARPAVIFVTAFDKYAMEAIRHSAFDYLLKPVTDAELDRVIKKYTKRNHPVLNNTMIQQLLENLNRPQRIKLTTAGGFIVVNTDNIVYIEADWNYSDIHLDNEIHHVVTTNIGTLEKMLPASDFCKITRSLIINLNYLNKVNRLKRLAVLGNNGKEITFKIPLLNIRKLEKQLEANLKQTISE